VSKKQQPSRILYDPFERIASKIKLPGPHMGGVIGFVVGIAEIFLQIVTWLSLWFILLLVIASVRAFFLG